MALVAKNSYPKAIPCHSPQELALENSRLSQAKDELAANTRRLEERVDDLAGQAQRARRWTVRLAILSVLVVLLAAGAAALVMQYPGLLVPAAPQAVAKADDAPLAQESKTTPTVALVKTNGDKFDAKKPPLDLPAVAAKPAASVQAIQPKADFLEALGGMSAAHLYQTQLNIGLLADGVESETYTIAEAEENLKSVVTMMKLVDLQLAKVAKAGIDKDDQESIREIQQIAGLLNLQAAALRAYWADSGTDQAAQYHKARKASAQGLAKVMGVEP